MDTAAPHSRSRISTLLALALAGTTALTGLTSTASAGPGPLQTVVVTGAAGVADAVRAAGGTVLDRLPLIGGVSARLPRGARLDPSYSVVPDRPVGLSGGTAASGPASTVRATLGLGAPDGEGAGTTVAVVDTGVADVADLAGRLSHVDVTGDGTGDGYGHGTFVAGLVAGDGSSSHGTNAGVAPGANVLDVRVAGDDGSSSLVLVLKGLQAVAQHPEVDVVNLSLSSGSPLPYQLDPLTQALEALWRRGVTVVVPAGNDGDEGRGSITSPGNDPLLLTVGGLDENGTARHRDDSVADWSSIGPAAQHVAKPEIVAPGAHLISAAATGSAIWNNNPSARVGDSYFRGSGTSFSSAVTSGAAAVLLADRSSMSPDQVKALVTGTTYDVDGSRAATGKGALDLAAALDARTPSARSSQQAGSNSDRIPGDAKAWERFLQALIDGDADAAASSWARLSPEARQWAARQWAELSPDARQWAARQWAARQWADRNTSADEWAARQWAARQWAARQWADGDWSARQWSARQWSARQWSARQWSDDSWTGDDWTARQWSARQWSARQWSATDWS